MEIAQQLADQLALGICAVQKRCIFAPIEDPDRYCLEACERPCNARPALQALAQWHRSRRPEEDSAIRH